MKNKMKQADAIIRRKVLAEEIDTNSTYIGALIERRTISEDMEERLIEALENIIAQLEKIIEG